MTDAVVQHPTISMSYLAYRMIQILPVRDADNKVPVVVTQAHCLHL
jgi:hypothetical protein